MYRLSYLKAGVGGIILGEWESNPTYEELITAAPYLVGHGVDIGMLDTHDIYFGRDKVVLEKIQ